jgi:GntR family transcriptional repressor for pyruvate dehydrogenase complex
MDADSPDDRSRRILDRVSELAGPSARTAAHLLAQFLQREIASSGIPAGARLFAEGELRQRTGLSRTVVREAIRLLESRGLVEVRAGARGGVYLRQYDYSVLRDCLALLISMGNVAPVHVLEARTELEALCAKLAAQRASDADVELLMDSLRRQERSEGDPAAFLHENVRFHLLMAECTHNPVVGSIVHSLRDIVHGTTWGYTYSSEALRAALLAHQRLVQAIAARDEEAAARIMRRHMEAVEGYLRRTGQI